MVHKITSEDEWNTLINSGKTVIVDFTAEWCGPCKMIAPVFEELSFKHAGYENVVFVKVDVDSLDMVSAACGVRAMPTFQVYKDGKNCGDAVGANKDKLEQLVNGAIALTQ